MSDLIILTVPDERLRKVSVNTLGLDLRFSKTDFVQKMVEKNGVGLAAPQVGILSRFFVMSETGKKETAILVNNPKIIAVSKARIVGDEGCLSIPGVIIPIWRYLDIEASWSDERCVQFTRKLTGWAARIFQHELDHLDGILITDRFREQNDDMCNDGLCC